MEYNISSKLEGNRLELFSYQIDEFAEKDEDVYINKRLVEVVELNMVPGVHTYIEDYEGVLKYSLNGLSMDAYFQDQGEFDLDSAREMFDECYDVFIKRVIYG